MFEEDVPLLVAPVVEPDVVVLPPPEVPELGLDVVPPLEVPEVVAAVDVDEVGPPVVVPLAVGWVI